MALPNGFKTFNIYFHEAISFLDEYSFLFKCANTDILSKGLLKKLPENWTHCVQTLNIDEIAALPYSKDNIFDGFFNKLDNLSPIMEECTGDRCGFGLGMNQKRVKGLSPKKQHEIFELSEGIHKQCVIKGVNLIVDLGSGLGYLSQLLYEKYGHNVIGIEGNIKNVELACKRQEKLFENSKNNVKYIQHYITVNSAGDIEAFCKALFSQERDFLIAGLHACADLTINAIKLFLNIDSCKGIFIMPCCYHKMCLNTDNCFEAGDFNKRHDTTKLEHNLESTEYSTENTGKVLNRSATSKEEFSQIVDLRDINSLSQEFDCFPLSDVLKDCCRLFKAEQFLQRPFLRLGCQRTQASWREDDSSGYEKRVFHLLSRAVLELYALKENARLAKTKQRGVRRVESNKCEFSSFLEDAIERGYVLEKKIEVTKSHMRYDQEILPECAQNGQKLSDSCVIVEENFSKSDPLYNQGIQSENVEIKQLERFDKCLMNDDLFGNRQIQSENVEIVKSPEFENRTLLSKTRKTKDSKRVYLDFDRIEINKLWNGLSKADFKAAVLFMILQDSLQGLCENIILLDKLAYISGFENIVQDYRFVKVTDDKISPRCFALVASKR